MFRPPTNNNTPMDPQLEELLKRAQADPDFLKKEYERLLAANAPLRFDSKQDPKEWKLDAEGGIVVEPGHGFVLKTKDKTGEKVFINFTHHFIIDEPEEKHLVDYENQAGIRIPMSVGTLREDFDKSERDRERELFDYIYNNVRVIYRESPLQGGGCDHESQSHRLCSEGHRIPYSALRYHSELLGAETQTHSQ
eukprot:TRINITY_DN2896_c0_g2_i4.p1 TRINITY_DN2896_c0_g2~~TRINITY_DN2896_c0_g2_i4.p1  ORF type:complete len:194 (-),score=32.75 TRINITY_DN2896_c0_g2_i4:45-626(-)